MKINPNVRKHIARFLELARNYPNEDWKNLATKKDYYYSTERQRKYVYVSAAGFMFKVDAVTGAIHCTLGRRPGYCLNIRDFLDEEEWENGKIGSNEMTGIPTKTTNACSACGNTNGVGRTAPGLKCRSCRSSDTRHINDIRRLGYTPMVNGRPLGDNRIK